MMWKAKPKKEKPAPPKPGDQRVRIRFALFPVRVFIDQSNERQWVWLEKFIALQEWKLVLKYNEETVRSGLITETVRCYTYLDYDWETIRRTKII